MNSFTNQKTVNNMTPFLGDGDAIIDIALVPVSGGYAFKVTKKSCKTGFITANGLSSKPDGAIKVSSGLEITLPTFAALQEYKFTKESVRINILNDEAKNQQNTAYNWTGSVLKWEAEIVDTFQPNI